VTRGGLSCPCFEPTSRINKNMVATVSSCWKRLISERVYFWCATCHHKREEKRRNTPSSRIAQLQHFLHLLPTNGTGEQSVTSGREKASSSRGCCVSRTTPWLWKAPSSMSSPTTCLSRCIPATGSTLWERHIGRSQSPCTAAALPAPPMLYNTHRNSRLIHAAQALQRCIFSLSLAPTAGQR